MTAANHRRRVLAVMLIVALTTPLLAPGTAAGALHAAAADRSRAAAVAEIGEADELLVTTAADVSAHAVLSSPRSFAAASADIGDVRPISQRVAIVEVERSRSGQAAAALADLPGVVAVEPNVQREFAARPNDSSFPLQWSHQQTNAEAGWELFTGSGNATVAVLDSGVDATHPDLQDQVVMSLRAAQGQVFAGTDSNDACGFGHGTAVAGIVGATGDNAFGLTGALWDVQLIDVALVSPEDNCRSGPLDGDIIAAVEHVAALPLAFRPDVINMSISGSIQECPQAMQVAINSATAAGILVVAAAGNRGNDQPSFPASCNSVMSVGATNADGGRASYSQFAEQVDVAAPGGEYEGRSCPEDFDDLVAGYVVSTSLTDSVQPLGPGCGSYNDPNGHRLTAVQGTSFSSPYVAGVAALLRDYHAALNGFSGADQLTPAQMEAAIENTALDVGDPGRDPMFGWGIVDVGAALAAVRDDMIGQLQPDPRFPVQGGFVGQPTGANVCPDPAGTTDGFLRIAPPQAEVEGEVMPSDPVEQAIAVSCRRGDGGAEWAVLAREDDFADALAGSAIGFGVGPLLYTAADADLHERTEAELLRVLDFSGVQPPTVYVMGGTAAVPASVDQRLSQLGIDPVRLAGIGREDTAAIAAREVVNIREDNLDRIQAENPDFELRDYAFVVHGRGFADAVTAGQMAAYYGIPVLATNSVAPLHPATAAALQELAPEQVFVVGGPEAIDEAAFDEVAALGFPAERLAGPTRIDTSLAVTREFIAQQQADAGGPLTGTLAVAVNLRRSFNDVLSATLLTAGSGRVFLPLEDATGDPAVPELTQATREQFCGFGGPLLVAAAPDAITDAAAAAAADLVEGTAC